MSLVKTNNFSMAYSVEDTPGVHTSTVWKLMEPNDITTWGGQLTTSPRAPISNRRQRRKGVPVDLESNVEFQTDCTGDSFRNFAEAFVFANFQGPASIAPASCDADSYTVPAGDIYPAGTLVCCKGAANSENNGQKIVDTGATTTDIPVVETLVSESFGATQNVTLDVCGVRGASGDITLTVTGTTGVLASTVLDFTTLDLFVGQKIYIGGLLTANQFSAAIRGFARITSLAANAIGLDKMDDALVTDAGTGKLIDILFGQYLKNVPVSDAEFLERTITFEGTFPDLGGTGTDEYEYPNGNTPNTMGIELPETEKIGIAFAFVGMDTESPTTVRKTGADAPLLPVQTGAYSVATHIAKLRITEVDETGITTDFKSASFVLNNNAEGEKVLATLGNKYVNTGNLEIDLEAEVVFTSGAVIDAIRDNTTVTMDFIIFNDDGGISFDVPSMTLGDGARSFPVNSSIKVALSGQAFEDGVLGTSIGISLFPVLPSVPVVV